MTDADALSPPKRVGTLDPGAKDLAESSESEDHFSDAQSAPQSPIPKTRVERVDTEPSYGEVPGTEAYRKRVEDAEPDEIAIIQDTESADETASADTSTPTGQPIPKTVVEESSGTVGAHSEEFLEKRKADAEADEVVKAEDQGGKNTDSPVLSSAASPEDEVEDVPSVTEVKVDAAEDAAQQGDAQVSPNAEVNESTTAQQDDTLASPVAEEKDTTTAKEDDVQPTPEVAEQDIEEDTTEADDNKVVPGTFAEAAEYDEDEDGDEGFGDDFDDFEEGGDDADFDDFEDGFQEAEAEAPPAPAPVAAPALPPSTLPFAIPDFEGLDSEDVFDVADPYLNSLFPPDELNLITLPPLSKENTVFSTPRSASLWSQLVAPPPLAPPDWIRSRIRRLFLVSLGVPVDLDEILPASKQKKLVLPSLHRKNSGSRRTSTESRSVSRLRQTDANASTTSIDSKGNAKPPGTSSRKKGPPPAPELDLAAVRQLATTTDQALDGMTDDELNAHIKRLKEMEDTAKLVLEHWKKKTDEKIGDREAFEGVIENLVKHARNSRK